MTLRTGENKQRQDRFGEGLVAMCRARKGEQEGRHSTYSNAVASEETKKASGRYAHAWLQTAAVDGLLKELHGQCAACGKATVQLCFDRSGIGKSTPKDMRGVCIAECCFSSAHTY